MTSFKSLEETKLLLKMLTPSRPRHLLHLSPLAQRKRRIQRHSPPLLPGFLCRLLARGTSQSGDREVRHCHPAFYDEIKLDDTFSGKVSTITEEGPQPSFYNEGVMVNSDHSSNGKSRREKGQSLRVQGERQYPRSSSSQLEVGPREPSAPVTTRLRPASFYSKINTFWRPTTPSQPQSSSTNTDSQRRGRPVLVGISLVFS